MPQPKCVECNTEHHPFAVACKKCSALTPRGIQQAADREAKARGEPSSLKLARDAAEAKRRAELGETDEPTVAKVVALNPRQPFEAHVAVRAFSTLINGQICRFTDHEVIPDFVLVGLLKANNCPILPQSQVEGIVCCPKCQHAFKPVEPSATRARRA